MSNNCKLCSAAVWGLVVIAISQPRPSVDEPAMHMTGDEKACLLALIAANNTEDSINE